ncbi:hypothetical protein [Mesorhizobium sp. A623]
MNYLLFSVVIAPGLIGLLLTLLYGPNRGVTIGGLLTLIAVFFLLIFQVTPPNFSSAWGLMLFEWYRWIPAFLVGAAIGSVAFRLRKR